MPRPARALAGRTALLLLGAALAAARLADGPLLSDEALFAALARAIVRGQDPLLSHSPLLVDKPPLFYTLLAGGVALGWRTELAARLPGFYGGLLAAALTARLARNLWRSAPAAALALAVSAFSPLAVVLLPTALADPFMLAFGLGALVAVTGDAPAARRWWLGGLLFGMAVACKQTGLYLLPLVVGMGSVRSAGGGGWGRAARLSGAFLGGLAVVALPWALWEMARAPAPPTWAAAAAANDPRRLAGAAEIAPRLLGWWRWARSLGGGWLATALLLGAAGWGAARGLRHGWGTSRGGYAVLLAAWALAYGGVHWLVAFPLFDRYLLPLVPVAALLAAYGLAGARWRLGGMGLAPRAGLVALLLAGGVQAAQGQTALGGGRAVSAGLPEAADTVLWALPEGAVVYHPTSLGWPLAYYAADAPVYFAAYDRPAALAADLRAHARPGDARYLLLPGCEPLREPLRAVEAVGFHAALWWAPRRATTCTVVLYALRSP